MRRTGTGPERRRLRLASLPTLRGWIASRTPPVPDRWASRLEPRDGDAPATVDALLRETLSAIRSALGRAPEDREGAFELLAADAFATWAAEAALEGEGEGSEEELLRLIRELQARTGRPE